MFSEDGDAVHISRLPTEASARAGASREPAEATTRVDRAGVPPKVPYAPPAAAGEARGRVEQEQGTGAAAANEELVRKRAELQEKRRRAVDLRAKLAQCAVAPPQQGATAPADGAVACKEERAQPGRS